MNLNTSTDCGAVRWPAAACGCVAGPGKDCLCLPSERALRAWMDGRAERSMLPVEREFCRQLIGCQAAVAGQFSDADLAGLAIVALIAASNVLRGRQAIR